VKKLLLIIIAFYGSQSFAQQVVEKKGKLTSNITEQFQYTVEGTKPVRNGLYRAFYDKKTLIASGAYKNDKKIGTWHFFSQDGEVLENYDYDNKRLLYERPEGRKSQFRYMVDDTLKDSDIVVQPIKPGGRLFGYIAYYRALKSVVHVEDLNQGNCSVLLKLLVSPMGRLADCTVLIGCNNDTPLTFHVNTDQLTEDDKTFIPATYNKKPISSTIEIFCSINRFGEWETF
jgi:hypothetical protein